MKRAKEKTVFELHKAEHGDTKPKVEDVWRPNIRTWCLRASVTDCADGHGPFRRSRRTLSGLVPILSLLLLALVRRYLLELSFPAAGHLRSPSRGARTGRRSVLGRIGRRDSFSIMHDRYPRVKTAGASICLSRRTQGSERCPGGAAACIAIRLAQSRGLPPPLGRIGLAKPRGFYYNRNRRPMVR